MIMNPEAPKAAPAAPPKSTQQAAPPAAQPAPTNAPQSKPDPAKVPPPAAEVKPAEPAKPSRPSIADELDEIAGTKQKKEEPKKEEPKPEGDLKVEEGDLKPSDPKSEEKPFTTAKELRTAYENQGKKLKAIEAELEKFKTGKVEDPEKKTLQEKLTEEAKRREQIEVELRFANYERSDDYKERFLKPMETAFEKAHKDVASMTIPKEDGTTVQATPEHFNKLIMMNAQDAATQAKAWFGDGAIEVMAHRRKIIELNESRQGAIEKYKKESEDRQKQMSAQQSEYQARVQSLWENSIQKHVEKYPEILKPAEGDDEVNTLLENGFKISDMAFSHDPDMPVEKRVALHAVVRNRAAAFDRLVHMNKTLSEKNSALEKELAEFKKSVPGSENGTESVPVLTSGQPQSWLEEIDQLARK